MTVGHSGYTCEQWPPDYGQEILRPEGGKGMRSGLGSVIYLVIGVFLASSHHYFEHVRTLRPVLSAASPEGARNSRSRSSW